MLFITPAANVQAAKDYFLRELAHGDYYLGDGEELPGKWHGLGADLIGLSGEVKQQEFLSLCDNRNPVSGERLTARTKQGRRVFYDFTFDAPKAVTLAYEMGGDERVLDAFRDAVGETMGEMEADIHTRVRSRGADADRRTSSLIWAEFVHRTTRPVDGVPDPQLHCHAVAFNATFDVVEEKWKAAQFSGLVRDKLYYQSAFHSRLAGKLQELGYSIKRDRNSFTLDGINRPLTDKFSRRSAVIEAVAKAEGITDPAVKSTVGRRTREAKNSGGAVRALRAEWEARLSGADRAAVSRLCDGARAAAATQSSAKASLDFALQHCFERSSVLPERRLVAEALMHGVGTASVRDVWRHARHAAIIRREVGGEVLTTTADVHREELAMLAFARGGRGRYRRLGGSGSNALDLSLSAEQREAASQILLSRDAVIGLRGRAGTGKTRLMQATVSAIEAGGRSVFVFAPSAKASRGVLREEGFARADTVERLLRDESIHQALQGQVLWIDEAGLLSTRDMRRLFDLARDMRCRLVLSGDSGQHSAVGRGDALRLLEKEAGVPFAELKDIRRQIHVQYREAVREISNGDARGVDGRSQLAMGIARLDAMGAILELQGVNRYKRLASDYAVATARRTVAGRAKTALVVAPTHREGAMAAEAIRSELRERRRITGRDRSFISLRSLSLTEAERGQACTFRGGEVIRFHQNVAGFCRGERVTAVRGSGDGLLVRRDSGRTAVLPLGAARHFNVYAARTVALAAGDRLRITLNGFTKERVVSGRKVKSRLDSGDTFEVAGFTKVGDIRLTNGFVVSKDYGGLTQGYVVTSHAAQGATADMALVALGSESLSAVNRQQFYVSVSRGREAVRLYTEDKNGLKEAVMSDASRLSATELLQARPGKTTKHTDSAGHLMVLQRSRRAYEAIRGRRVQGTWQSKVTHAEAHYGRH